MNRDHARTSAMLTHNLSASSQHAVQQRTKRLTDDAYADRQNESARKSKNRRAATAITKKAQSKVMCTPKNYPWFLERVRFHLSRGRDAADIAMREGWLMSKVNEAIKEIQK